MRLCSLAAAYWSQLDAHYFNIENARGKRGLLHQPPARFVGLTYAWAIERVAPEKVEDWEFELVDLLPWQDSQSEAATEIESDSFFAMMATGGGG